MTKRTWITALVLTLLGTCTVFIHRPIGFGFLLGSVLLWLLTHYILGRKLNIL